jgi:hypothetical protein
MEHFIITTRGGYVRLGAVERIELLRYPRGVALLLYSPEHELGAVPGLCSMPDGFIELIEPRQIRAARRGDVAAVWINTAYVDRLVRDDETGCTYRAYDANDELLGLVRGPLDLPTIDLRASAAVATAA